MPTDPPLPFQSFYTAHRAAVLRLLVAMVGPQDAQDCFQEAWLKVLRSWPPTDPDGRVDSWVLTIAHRTGVDHLRRIGREQPVADPPERPAPVDDLVLAPPAELWDAVAALTERQRTAVVLRIVLDRTHADVARVLDCSEDAARRCYADALAALRANTEVTP